MRYLSIGLIKLMLGVFLAIFLCGQASVYGAPGIPQTLRFQGKVTNADGTNVTNGTYDFVFKLYDGASSGAANPFTESWTSAALWSSTMSSAPGASGESLTYSSNTNESTINVGQILWNTTKQEAVVVTTVNTSTNVVGISPTLQAWAGSDTVTNRIYVKDGIFSVSLNGLNQDLSGVDFNSDSIFLGVNYNADGEMKPRIQFASVPYAKNAERVNGLTVTNTTGTFTLTSGKTFTIGNSVGFTGTDSTSFILPGANDTLTGNVASQTLTNKTIGSTGLAFSGATTDITTAGGEALIINGNAASTFQTSAGSITLQAAGTGTISVVQIGVGGAGSTTPDYFALDVKSDTGDPAGGAEGYMYYNTSDNKFRCFQNASWTDCIGAGGSSTLQDSYDNDVDGSNTIIGLTANDGSLIIRNTTGTQFIVDMATSTAATVDLAAIVNTGSGQATSTTAVDGLQIDFATGGSTASANNAGARINVTSNNSGSGTTLYGLEIANLTSAETNATETAIRTGTGWDYAALFESGNVGIGTSAPTEALTVGSATNRKNIEVNGDLRVKGFVDETNLTGIIDVFVYEVTRDSDTGDWTNSATSRGLSWFNEVKDDGPGDDCIVATDDRCGNSRFPKEAILITTADGLYIFDGKANTLWMKFTQAGTFALGADTNNNPSGVFALNGVVYVGTNGTAGSGLYAFDFVNDRMYQYDTTDRQTTVSTLSQRNSAVTYGTNSLTTFALNNNIVNDVHGAIIYGGSNTQTNGGPLNGAIFIVAATDALTSVINLSSGKVLDYGQTAGSDINQAWLTSRGRLYQTNETLAQVERFNDIDIDTADQLTPDDIFDEQAVNVPHIANAAAAPTFSTSPGALYALQRTSMADDAGDTIFVGHSAGVTEIHDVTGIVSATSFGWSRLINISGETTYMSGTPRAMFMFNETSGDLIDATIRQNNFQPNGGVTYGASGVRGTALTFNGSTGYLCSDANADNTCDQDTDFDAGLISSTIELWFRHPVAITGTDTLLDHSFTTANVLAAGYRLRMNSTGTITYGIDDDAVAFDDDLITSVQSYNDNLWHHVVAVNTDTAILLFIDGKLVGSDSALAATLTLTAANVPLVIGADLSVSGGANYWDGQIDDVYISMGGATTSDTLTQAMVRRKYIAGRAALIRPATIVTAATAFSSTTIGDSGEAYTPNDFVGTIVEITGGTGVGQTRRVIANDATTFTVSPAWTVTPDTTSNYEVIPEQLYGSSNNVTTISLTDTEFLAQARTMYIGTNNGTDGGGVTVLGGYRSQYITDVYHADTARTDSSAEAWSGTDVDDIQSISSRADVTVISTQQGMWIDRSDNTFEETTNILNNNISNIRQELVVDGLLGTSSEVGAMGGADLAEYYSAAETMEPGTVVVVDSQVEVGIKKSATAYQSSILGVVATSPGIILGNQINNGQPVALVGRVPVQVNTQNGIIKAGDSITSSDVPGIGMKATKAGRVLGVALQDMEETALVPCTSGNGLQCATLNVFVNLTDYNGSFDIATLDDTSDISREDQILTALRERKSTSTASGSLQSTLNTDTVLALDVYVDSLYANSIKAKSIEGLEILTDALITKKIASSATPSATLTPLPQPTVDTRLDQLIGLFTLSSDGSVSLTRIFTFAKRVVFGEEVEFVKTPSFNSDAGGFAVIKKGATSVTVEFETAYKVTPVVNSAINLENSFEEVDMVASEEALLADNISFIITRKSKKGFTIKLNKKAPRDISFSWNALTITNPKTSVGNAKEEPTIIPSVVPSETTPTIQVSIVPGLNVSPTESILIPTITN